MLETRPYNSYERVLNNSQWFWQISTRTPGPRSTEGIQRIQREQSKCLSFSSAAPVSTPAVQKYDSAPKLLSI